MTYDQPTHPPCAEGDEREDEMTPEEYAAKRHDDDHDALHAQILALNARIETLMFRIGKLEQAMREVQR